MADKSSDSRGNGYGAEDGAKRLKSKNEEGTKSELENILRGFETTRVLNSCSREKSIFVHGKVGDQNAVIILEKTPIREDSLTTICSTSTIQQDMKNDIYYTLSLVPPPHVNEIKATVICPATEKHVKKYESQEVLMVEEKSEDYLAITLPYIQSQSFSLQWVYNILEKKAEADRIIYEDPDPKLGFILLPDYKWDQKQISNLYLIAISHMRNIQSLRDLTSEHIPLLQNILLKGQAAILEHYKLSGNKLRIYLHYQPSYYHLHVHFTVLTNEGPGCFAGRAHLLTDVIQNLQSDPQFYKTRALYFTMRADSELVQKFKEAERL